jgi:hypothetical protein
MLTPHLILGLLGSHSLGWYEHTAQRTGYAVESFPNHRPTSDKGSVVCIVVFEGWDMKDNTCDLEENMVQVEERVKQY